METGLQKDTWHNQYMETIHYQFILHNFYFVILHSNNFTFPCTIDWSWKFVAQYLDEHPIIFVILTIYLPNNALVL